MALTCEVRRVLSRNPNEITPDNFRLKFESKKPLTRKEKRQSRKDQRALAIAKWKALAGYKEPKKD